MVYCLTFLVISCDKDNTEPGIVYGKRINKVFIKECNDVAESNDNRDYYVHLEYDDQNRLVKYTEEHLNVSMVTTLTWLPGEVSFDMDGRSLGKYILNEKGYAARFDMELSKPYVYEYNTNGNLIKSTNEDGTNTYGYENGNLVSWSCGHTSCTFVTSQTEDKMASPAMYQLLHLYLQGNASTIPAYLAGLFGKSCSYLPTEGEQIFTLNGEVKSTFNMKFTYEYDEEGYVTRATESLIPDVLSGDMRIYYEQYELKDAVK
jgi:hypothetical protein